jgi:hypothetical protein
MGIKVEKKEEKKGNRAKISKHQAGVKKKIKKLQSVSLFLLLCCPENAYYHSVITLIRLQSNLKIHKQRKQRVSS